MFTINQVKEAHSKVKSGADFPGYVQELKRIGVVAYDLYVADGHIQYFGVNNFKTQSGSSYAAIEIAPNGSAEKLSHSLRIHQNGETDYLTFCREAAAAGVEKWTVHVIDLTCTYYDKAGNQMVIENIPVP